MGAMEGFDRAVLDRLRDAIGEADFLALVRTFVDDLRRMEEAIADAFQAGDRSALSSAVHELKGAAGFFGATRLVGSCADLKDGTGSSDAAIRAAVDRVLEQASAAAACLRAEVMKNASE